MLYQNLISVSIPLERLPSAINNQARKKTIPASIKALSRQTNLDYLIASIMQHVQTIY